MPEPKEIVVVGAGVVGLSCALAISEHSPIPHRITVIAEHLPEDHPYSSEYTSQWAGAHFRPIPSSNEAQLREYKLTRITQTYFRQISEIAPESSIKFIKGIEYLEEPDQYYQNFSEGYREDMSNFEQINQLPSGVKLGTSYDTWVVNPPIYIQYLRRRLLFQYDVKFIKAKLGSLKEINKYVKNSIIINCSGNGLQYEGGYDEECFPIRGQTLLVNPPAGNPYGDKTITHQLKDGLWTFCIPRPLHGGIILGGTKQVGDKTNTPKIEDTNAITARGRVLFPELMKTTVDGEKYFDIVQINVGFRPARKNGMNLNVDKYPDNIVINAYGAGGQGYELSYGVGVTVNEKLTSILHMKSKF